MTIEDPLWMQGASGTPSYSAREDRLLLAQLWDEGVADLTAFKVSQRGAGANFSVDVSIGVAVVQGDDQTNQGNYLVRETAVENAVVTGAPGSNSRYDIVCLRINDPNAGGSAGYTATIVVTAGTPAASPTVPATPASSLLLAVLGPITTSTPSITTSLIHDQQTGTGPAEALGAHMMRGLVDMPGALRDWMGSSLSVPNGWLMPYGQAISRTTYARLFSILSTTYGVGDGATTFNLPDLRGRVPVGLDNMGGSDAARLAAANALGGAGGTADAAVVAHTHTGPSHSHSIDHDHGSVETGGETADHTHAYSGTTGDENASHYHGTGDGTYDRFVIQSLAPGSSGLQTVNGGILGPSNELGTGTEVGAHQHNFSGDTGGVSSDHSHGVDLPNFTGSSGAAGTGATGSTGSSATDANMPPYILVNKIIRT